MKEKASFKSHTSAQIIILTGFVIAIIIVGMGTVLYSVANSGQQTSILQSDRAYDNFENIREEYGTALMASSEYGKINPYNASNTTNIFEFEDRMKTIVESHGYFLNFTDHNHDEIKKRGEVNILFMDGKKVFNDFVTYDLSTGKIVFDTIPPGFIYDLDAKTTECFGDGFVELNWTAVGNDYYEDSTAYKYEIRYSNGTIDTQEDFYNATLYGYYYNVKNNGSQETFFVEELDPVFWNFAIKVYDKAGNFNFSNSTGANASEWSPEVYNITANNVTSNFTEDDPYQPNLFADGSDDITIEFQVRDRDNDNVSISLMLRSRSLSTTGWNYGDWFEAYEWPMGDYSGMILSHTITDIDTSWDYYFNVSDNSTTCPKERSVPSGAPDDYYWIEVPYMEYSKVESVNDAYIKSADSSSNFGSVGVIEIEGTPNPIYGLIKFDLSTIPASATIESANISIYCNETSALNISFHIALQPWDELNVTWDNWEPTGNYSSSANFSVFADTQQYYDLNATADVEYFHNNRDKNYGWLIEANKNQLVMFDSKEAVNASRRPVLHVLYSE